jgi:hypothetical protein
METMPSDLIMKVVDHAIDLAMKCMETGETLLAFIITEGAPGAIHSLIGESFAETLTMAQEQVDGFGSETIAFAFAYDGFIPIMDKKNDCIYIEAAEIDGDKSFLFAQQYQPRKKSNSVERIGNCIYLKQGHMKLKVDFRTWRSTLCR